jgi:hypothetical protein
LSEGAIPSFKFCRFVQRRHHYCVRPAKVRAQVESHWMRVLLRSSACVSQIGRPLTVERHDFDKRPVGGMTEEWKLKVTASTLDSFHDEPEHRLPIPTHYIVDSEGVTPGKGQSTPLSRLELGLQLQKRTRAKRARMT